DLGLLGEADGNAVQPFGGAKPEIELQNIRIGGDLLGLRRRGDETRSGQHFETLVDADKKLGRDDRGLDRAELGAFDLSRDGAELARRVHLRFEVAAAVLFASPAKGRAR